jgi:hypothetical protein
MNVHKKPTLTAKENNKPNTKYSIFEQTALLQKMMAVYFMPK